MRVIAGALKGRRLKAPTWNGLRPTSDKLRGTLFNVLAPLIEGARVLDAYAGTGALGIEALSRGAVEVIFVERDRRAQALIAENLAHCGAASGCAIIRASLAHAIEELRRRARSFDVVLLDPPYDVAPEAAIVPASALLAPEGCWCSNTRHGNARPTAQAGSASIAPEGAVVLSPVTDLALTGESFETRAEADPYFVRSQAVRSYLGKSDPKNPLASPPYGNLAGLPPVRVHVGDDEVLLDDSRRYVERAVSAGVDAKLDVWMGMPHGFVNSVGNLHAANQALRAIGAFLSDRLDGAR